MKACISLLAALVATSSFEETKPADRFFDSDGVRIRYVDDGQGAPVILIHGYSGNVDRHWIAPGVFADLAADHRVIAFDCRGHGQSGKPTTPDAYGRAMSDDVARLLDHLKIRRAHIVGYSMGAMIAGHFLTTHAERTLSATFVAYHPVRVWTSADEADVEASARDLESDTPFRLLIRQASPPDAPPSEADIRKFSQTLAAVNDVKALAAYHRGRRGLVVTDAQLATSHIPALGIIGSADPSVASMRALEGVMPTLRVVVVEGATHGGDRGILRTPQFRMSLREFLAAPR
jgi:pimeloyl-ACP methyl ester carboxylesterase